MSTQPAKPFSMGYVMRITQRHQREAIDQSIRMTFARVAEFAHDQEKSQEIFRTISALHTQRKALDDFQAANPEMFKG